MKAIVRAFGVARSNLLEQLQKRRKPEWMDSDCEAGTHTDVIPDRLG